MPLRVAEVSREFHRSQLKILEEVERFFEENRILQAEKGIEAGMEKLKIYDRLIKKA